MHSGDLAVPPYFRTRWGGTTSYHHVIARPSFGEWTGVVCEVLSVSVEEHGLRFKDEVRATAEVDMSRDFEAIEAEEWHEIVANYVKPRST